MSSNFFNVSATQQQHVDEDSDGDFNEDFDGDNEEVKDGDDSSSTDDEQALYENCVPEENVL
jgi:hypothetical protein